jgi:Oxidoreductase molybdopterin binding domain
MPTPLSRLRTLAGRPLPAPPEAFRRGPFRAPASHGADQPHDARTARLVGTATGLALLCCLVTGLISHLQQHPVSWFDLPSRPVWGYQVTQGLHVISGIALVPLVLAKLWVVFPRLFGWPPVRSLGHAAERALIAPLVAGTLFELTSGLLNIVQWYPWRFFFPRAHWAVAWIVAGAVGVHVAVKAPVGRRPRPAAPDDVAGAGDAEGPGAPAEPDLPTASRRAVLAAAGTAAVAVTLATAGQTVPALRGISVLAPRRPQGAPGGVPINRTATDAGVRAAATDPGWRLVVAGPHPVTLSLADLAGLPQHEASLPIACVEGWSATARWAGVRLRDVLDLAHLPPDAHLRLVSLERGGIYGSSPMAPPTARDPLTLLALRLGGLPLSLDHGYPLRLIAPNRPGVQQTKWLARIEQVTA